MRKKVERYSLKFKHSNWNIKFGNSIYCDFEVKFRVFPKVIFGHTMYHFTYVLKFLAICDILVKCF